MVISVFNFCVSTIAISCSILWFLSRLAMFLIHYFLIFMFFLLFSTKFVKLPSLSESRIDKLFDSNSWCVSYLGSYFDVPENSKASIDYSLSMNCKRILLSLDMTIDGHLVVVDKQTLEKANIHKPVNKVKFEVFKELNVSEAHPLGKQYDNQKILTLDCLLKTINTEMYSDVIIILKAINLNAQFIEKLRDVIKTNSMFTDKIIFCCKSPLTVYKLRKLFPALICGIWTENISLWKKNKRLFKILTVFRSIYDVILRNLIAPIVGFSLIFVHKDEFNTHISELWQNVGVIPIVYHVNSPSEKRYYQNVIKTRYLTASLRSEPQIIFNKTKN
ncbi:unnamed protein product [Diamesa serratosioi]